MYVLNSSAKVVRYLGDIALSISCGKGYATEAAQWFVTHAFENPKVKIVSATTLSDTGASSHVLRKCGMLKVGRIFDFEHGKLWKWEIAREEFVLAQNK